VSPANEGVTLTRRDLLRGAAQLGAALAAGSAIADPLPLQICTTKGLLKTSLRAPQPPPPAMLHPERLQRFVDPLPIPNIARSSEMRADPRHPGGKIPFYRIAMRESQASVHRDLAPARFWGYEGSMPGPTFEVRSGQPFLIEWANELPERHLLPIDYTLHGAGKEVPQVRAVVHVHGARVPPESDGYPEHWYVPGNSATYRYPNRQDAATLWYHDHAMGIERLNVYAGLLGAFLIRDAAEDALQLPHGEYEIPLLIFDRQFTSDGQLYYPTSGVDENPWVSEAYGDAILINGKLTPFLEVEPRPYRFRIVNASNARFYYLSLSNGTSLVQIGSDQGLLQEPYPGKNITLSPAERGDVIIDFSGSAGQQIILQSQALELMQFRVADRRAAGRGVSATVPVPAKLRPTPRLARSTSLKTRFLTLNNYEDPSTHMEMMLLNGTYWHQPVTEKPRLNSVEIWELANLTEDTHPIHLHMVRFQVLDRQRFDVDEYLMSGKLNLAGPPIAPTASERGWKDTVQAHSGLITRIIIPFQGYPGRYVWHCHMLEHAGNEMMRPFDVVGGGFTSPPLVHPSENPTRNGSSRQPVLERV
jgi:spore coat protein A, manganese oxidase